MQTFNHACIRLVCRKPYSDSDPEPYYCPECKERAKEIEKKIDAQKASIPRKEVKSELQIYDELQKATGSKFVRAKDLGMK